jgi:hypothetical protein
MEVLNNFYQYDYKTYIVEIQNNFLNLINTGLNLKINSNNNILLLVVSLITLYLFITLGIAFIKKIVEFNVLLFISVFTMNFFMYHESPPKEVIKEAEGFWNRVFS